MEWQQYRIEPNGIFTKLTIGILGDYDYFSGFKIGRAVSTVDEGYALVYVNKINNFTAEEPFLPQSGLFVLFIGYNQIPVSQLLLYQHPLPNVTYTGLSCANLIDKAGQVCTLNIVQKGPVGLQDKIFY